MILAESLPRKSRLAALLDHFADVEDPRDVRRILHPLSGILLLVVCGTVADCDDYEDIAGWGGAPRLPTPASALRQWGAGRALAHHPDEPDQPRALRRRLRRLSLGGTAAIHPRALESGCRPMAAIRPFEPPGTIVHVGPHLSVTESSRPLAEAAVRTWRQCTRVWSASI